MAKRILKSFPVSQDVDEAIKEYCEENELNFSEETRNYWLDRIGRPDLKEQIKMGRPSKP